MYQSISTRSHPTGQPSEQIFKNRQIPGPRANFLCQIPGGGGLPAILDFNKFYTFSQYSRPQSLIYPLNIYKLVERT